MTLRIVGIIDYSGQAHCMDHASTVASYQDEIYSVDPVRKCWCGVEVGGERPKPLSNAAYVRMNDGVRGQRNRSPRTFLKGRK